jgi:hypothetical protein
MAISQMAAGRRARDEALDETRHPQLPHGDFCISATTVTCFGTQPPVTTCQGGLLAHARALQSRYVAVHDPHVNDAVAPEAGDHTSRRYEDPIDEFTHTVDHIVH